MANKKAVTLEHLSIVKKYINDKDAKNIKSAEFVDNTLKFYTSEDKSGDPVAALTLPEETFLDSSKTEFVNEFAWSNTKYPKSTNPDLDGKPVLVFAVKTKKTVKYSFISLDTVVCKLTGASTDTADVSLTDNAVSVGVKVSELPGNRVVVKDDGLYVGVVDNTPTWSISTNGEVSTMFSTSGYGAGTLGAKNVGDIVKIKENGVNTDFIIVHKGNPDPEIYDVSCDGVWLVREKAHSQKEWNSSNSSNDYEKSTINVYLNKGYFNSIDSFVGTKIKDVKIPYKKGRGGDSSLVLIGENGLQCKTFLLSSNEVGFSSVSYVPSMGVKLDYFVEGFDDEAAIEKRLCKIKNGDSVGWWLRSPVMKDFELGNEKYGKVSHTSVKGSAYYSWVKDSSIGVRPAFILPYDVRVNSDNEIVG